MLDVGSTTADVIPVAGGPRGRRRPHRPRPAPGRRARLHGRAADQPRGDRAARPGARRLVPGRLRAVRDQRRRAPDPRPPRARGLHVPDAGRPAGDRRVRPRARRAARLRRRGAARARRDRRDRRPPPRGAGAARSRRRRGRSARAFTGSAPPVVPLGAGAFLARAVAERLGRAVVELPWSAAERDAAPAAALAELAAAAPRARARRADRRQGRRRARARGRRRRAAGAVRGARGGGRAPSAARRARRRGLRRRGPRRTTAASACAPRDRAPDGDPGDGPVRLGARRPHPGRGAPHRPRAGRAGVVPSCCPPRCWPSATRSPPSWASPRTRSPRGWPARRAPRGSCSSSRSRGSTASGRRPASRSRELTVDELAALRPGGVDAHLPAALRAAGSRRG